VAVGNISVPLVKLHEISQKEHAVAGFAESEVLHDAAAFAQALYRYLFCWEPKEFTMIRVTTAVTAMATVIMIRYSREPCALAMIG
jgi:hypothetical protein